MYTQCFNCLSEIFFPDGKDQVRCPACTRINDRPKTQGETMNRMKRANELCADGEFEAAASLYHRVLEENLDEMLRLLQAYLLTIPQCDNTNYEGHYQQLLYVIFSLLGRYVDVEVRTATGRVDMVMRTAQKLYLLELKLNRSAEAAMKQIDLKNYPARFALCQLPVVKVGINFDAEQHTITDWQIEA